MQMSIYEILERYWRYPAFRPLQEEVIQNVLAGRDTLALMPTGGGKSICFQVPALVKEGICIVVTPLIALMKDQVEELKKRDIPALAIFAGMSKREVDIALDNCVYGGVKLLYLSPERLLNDLVRERIRHMNVNLFAVDEAHCISEWGYDFRPAYLHLAELRELHPKVPVLALTATATTRVVSDIQEKLHFRPAASRAVFIRSFARPNLAYMALYEEHKSGRLLKIIRRVGGSGIVYVRNRRETHEIARYLSLEGISADFYHAGLTTPVRSAKQDAWKQGKTQVIVATNAFGMGIDKPDVRFVVHLDLPDSLEAYYQEAGRAGRDGEKAYSVLLYHTQDKLRLERNFVLSFPSIQEITQIYYHLGNYFQLAYGAGQYLTFDFDLADFCKRYQLEALKTMSALRFLERDEWIALSENVYMPSRLRFEVDPANLYRFQVAHAHLDGFIKTILRAYGGAFNYYVSFREQDLARKAMVSLETAVKYLNQLRQYEIISYLPQTDKPQLQFLQPRADSQHLSINKKHLDQRREVGKEKLNAVLDFLAEDRCRLLKILDYFGEDEQNACGICDYCLHNQPTNQIEDLAGKMTIEVINLLSREALLLDELVNKLQLGSETEKITLIRNLVDTGKLKYINGRYSI